MRISDWSSDGCSSDLFTDITASLAHRLQEADITLTVNPLPQLTSDRLALEQVFSNLLDNAIKYMRNNIPGRIDVTVTDRSEEHTSELQSLMRISYAVFCLKKKNTNNTSTVTRTNTD